MPRKSTDHDKAAGPPKAIKHKPRPWKYDHMPSDEELSSKKPHAAAITQEELAEYRELQSLVRKAKEMRKSLLERLEAGAGVQPGTLWPDVETRPLQVLTWARLTEVFGEKRTAFIREHLEPTACRYLTIVERSPRGGRPAQRARRVDVHGTD
jgi:hypothetical protein